MFRKVTGSLAVLVCIVAAAQAQDQNKPTPPPKVTTPDITIPTPLKLAEPSAPEIGAQPLTPEEAVAIALRKQPTIGIAMASVTSAQGRTQQATSVLNPQIIGAAGFNDSRSLLDGGEQVGDRFSASVGLQQLVYDFGHTRAQVRQQEALERSLRHTLTRTQQSIAMQVRLAFYDLVQSREDVTTSEANVTNRQRELDQANARMNSGLGPPVDVVQAKTNLAAAVISLVSAQENALGSQVSLAQLLGIDSRTPINLAAGGEKVLDAEADLSKLVLQALSTRPDIKAAREQVTAAHFAISAAKTENLPNVSASAGISGAGPNDPFSSRSGAFGVNVTVTFGDGGFTAGRVKEAQGNEEAARQSLIDTTNQAVTDVSQAYVQLQSALKRVTVAQDAVVNAQELVRISEGRYTGGLGQFLDV
ncbi:MAG TPA: TolC family protein, partial [Fimbriimonas sp.]|nr:TolC family protein [Fimbriimonas sp.]